MAYLLIVDDDEDFAGAISMVMKNAGHEVAVELDTKSALTSMEQRKPDLLILDVMFPEDSSAGFDLARTVRHQREGLKDMPILMLTAVNQKYPIGFGNKDIDDNWMPVSEFLEKPVEFDVLKNKVEALLKKEA